MKTRLVALALAGTLAQAACGGGGSGTPSDTPDASLPDATPPILTLADVCDSSDGAFVRMLGKFYECFPELEFFAGSTPSAAELSALCVASYQPFLDDNTVALGEYSALAACVEFLDGLTCENLAIEAPNPCNELLVGMVPEGSGCEDGVQCAGPAHCSIAEGETCGTCALTKADNEPCFIADECTSGYCSGADQAAGTPGACRALGAAGEPCASAADCVGTLFCDKSGAAPVCAVEPTWEAGSPCSEFSDCNPFTSGLFCNEARSECEAFAQLGQPCQTSLCNYLQYERCQRSGTQLQCVAPTTVELGGACGRFEGLKCADGLFCGTEDSDAATPDVCIDLHGQGESCANPDEFCGLFLGCANGATCEYASYLGTCATE